MFQTHFSDAQNQLFNLTADPDELYPIQNAEVEKQLTDYLLLTLISSVHSPEGS